MSTSWARGSTRAWRRVRAFVLDRDGWRCRAHADRWCERAQRRHHHRCTGTATVVHHTRGRAVTGDDPRYLVAACAACNLHIGEPAAAGDPPNRGVTRW